MKAYQITIAEDGTLGLIAARTQNPNLLILGWKLPGVSCLEICQRIRSTGSTIPIFVLTEDHVTDRIAGLDAGADDCITKPFSIQELIARIQAHLWQIQKQETHILRFENLVLDRSARQVFLSFRLIELTTKEFDLLEYLMLHMKQVLTREQMMQNVLGYDFMGTSNASNCEPCFLLRMIACCKSRLKARVLV